MMRVASAASCTSAMVMDGLLDAISVRVLGTDSLASSNIFSHGQEGRAQTGWGPKTDTFRVERQEG